MKLHAFPRVVHRLNLALGLTLLQVLLLVTATHSSAQGQKGGQPRQLQQKEPVESWPSKAKRWALVIGVDQYRDGNISPLRGAANDADTLAKALVEYAGFPSDQVILLATDQTEQRQPTRINILAYLSNLASLVPKDGLLLVSFSGHGIDRGGQAYLIPSDARLTNDISLLEDSAVSVERVREKIRSTGVGQVVLLLDACRNDPGGRADAPNPLTQAYTRGFNFDVRNSQITAFVTIYATAIGQRAYEYIDKKQGYFTWSVVEGMKGGAANDKGEVTLASLIKYVQETVPKRVSIDLGVDKLQQPFYQMEGYKAEELVIAVAKPSTSTTPVASSIQMPNPAAIELSYWETIRGSNNPEDFKSYLKKYPNGTFVELAMNHIKSLEITTSPKQPSPSSRGAKSEKVLVWPVIQMPGSIFENSSLETMFISPFFQSLVKKGLDVTNTSDEKLDWSESLRLRSIFEKLRAGNKTAGHSIPFALVVYVDIRVTALEPYSGLYVTEANGKIEAVDTNDGKVVALERISGVRGFGNDLKQAEGDTLKNVGEGISESFIKLVAQSAH